MTRLSGVLRHLSAAFVAASLFLAMTLTLATAPPLEAQTVGTGQGEPVVLHPPANTRALGLGGAFHGGQRESDALFASPGDLTSPTGMEAAFQRWGDGSTLVQMTAGTDWWSGGVALGVRSLSDDASELQLSTGYGRVLAGVRVGAAGSVLQFRTEGRAETTGALSLGAARALGPIVLSASVLNLGGGLETPPVAGDIDLDDVTPQSLLLSREIALGAASRNYPLGPLDLGAAARLAFHEDGATTYGGGLEVSYWPIQGRTFSLRIGARDAHSQSNLSWWTTGAGFRGDRLGLDYALMPFEDGTISHRFGLIFR